MIGWKVVNKNCESVILAKHAVRELALQYKIGKTTIAPCHTMGVFFFKNKKDAIKFAILEDRILKVIAPDDAHPRKIHEAYNPRCVSSNYKRRDEAHYPVPENTYVAAYVKVIKEILVSK